MDDDIDTATLFIITLFNWLMIWVKDDERLVCVGDFEQKHTKAGAAGSRGYASLAPLASRQEGNLSLPGGGVGG